MVYVDCDITSHGLISEARRPREAAPRGTLLAYASVQQYVPPTKTKAELMSSESTIIIEIPGLEWAAIAVFIAVLQLSLGTGISHAHQHPCHRLHSCPPDPAPYYLWG